MKRFLFFAFVVFISHNLSAQGFTQAVGIRAGWISPGIEYRYYKSDIQSFKALLSVRERGLQLHALTEFYKYDLFPFSYQLLFFYGAGIHFGFESWDVPVYENNQRLNNVRSSVLAGVDGLLGLEYIFYEAPVSVGLEIKPFIDVFGQDGFKIVIPDFAFTVKYLF